MVMASFKTSHVTKQTSGDLNTNNLNTELLEVQNSNGQFMCYVLA